MTYNVKSKCIVLKRPIKTNEIEASIKNLPNRKKKNLWVHFRILPDLQRRKTNVKMLGRLFIK